MKGIKLRKAFLRILKANDGFTLLELLVGMFIASLTVVLLWGLTVSAIHIFSHVSEKAVFETKALYIDSTLRNFTEKASPPFWILPNIKEEKSSISIPFMKEGKENNLKVTFLDNVLVIETNDEKRIFYNIDACELLPLRSNEGMLAGLECKYSIEGSSFETFAIFNSFSVPGDKKNE